MNLTVYLAGQIHDDWRDDLRAKAEARGLGCTFVGPQTIHDLSDNIGENILGKQPNARWKDEVASQVNNLRTRVLMARADVVIVNFGMKYKQWNAAMDAALAIAKDKPVIIIRPTDHIHALKELSNRAQLTVETVDQALEALAYIFEGLD